jgi:hypothetical protein
MSSNTSSNMAAITATLSYSGEANGCYITLPSGWYIEKVFSQSDTDLYLDE